MSVSKNDITIYQSADFNLQMTWTDMNNIPYDLTGYSAVMQIKSQVGYPAVLELSDVNGGIKLGVDGTIVLSLTHLQTKILVGSLYLYDLFLTDTAGKVTKFLEGKVNVDSAISDF